MAGCSLCFQTDEIQSVLRASSHGVVSESVPPVRNQHLRAINSLFKPFMSQNAMACAKYLVDKLTDVPERQPADGSGAFRTQVAAALERLDVRQPGLAEAVSHGVAFHHGSACIQGRARIRARVRHWCQGHIKGSI